jgi:uncharacterized protein (DUF2236 family)
VIREELARRFRRLLSGAPTGVPDWTPLIAAGDDAGYFSPTDAPWIVHADFATLIGGIRALLVQAMHPGSLAGVVQHSRYEEDVLGRLSGTIRWLTSTTFASTTAVEEEAARVRHMHERVRGNYTDSDGELRNYRASDHDLLSWVHLAFTDSFLAAHMLYGGSQIPGGPDAYVKGWGKSVVLLGLKDPPESHAQLSALMGEFDSRLIVDERTKRVVRFIRRAPLPVLAQPLYRLLFHAAVDSLPDTYRQRLGLRRLPGPLVRSLTRLALRAMRAIVGTHSPLEEAALSRLHRLRSTDLDAPNHRKYL